MRYSFISALFVAAVGCTTPAAVFVQPEELVMHPGDRLTQDTEVALEIGWDETLRMGEHPRPRITWYLPCAAPLSADGSTIITYAESCSASSVNGRGDVALQWTGSIASSWLADALVGLKAIDLYGRWYYSGDRADIQRIRDALAAAGL